MRKKVIVAVGLAAVAVLSLWLWSRSVVKEVQGGDKVKVIVAADEIAPGTRVQKAHLAYREMPESYVHDGIVRATGAALDGRARARVVLAD